MDPQELVPLESGLPRHRPSRQHSQIASRSCYKGPIRLCRMLAFMIFLPCVFIFVPLYMRYRVFSGQMYPMSMTDMRLIDGKISPTWCQRQVVKSNTTFNAFVVPGPPELTEELVPVSMTRELELEDDMKEYWGFYLLQGSTVTVSACVSFPGASLIMIKGYKHLQECAYIGDDSSEELDELLEAHKLGLLSNTTLLEKIQELHKADGKANDPGTMKRHKAGVSFHDPSQKANVTSSDNVPTADVTDHDPKELREILERLHGIRQAAKNEALKHYRPPSHLMSLPALHRHRDTNVDRDERKWISFEDIDGNITEQIIMKHNNTDKKNLDVLKLNNTRNTIENVNKSNTDATNTRSENPENKINEHNKKEQETVKTANNATSEAENTDSYFENLIDTVINTKSEEKTTEIATNITTIQKDIAKDSKHAVRDTENVKELTGDKTEYGLKTTDAAFKMGEVKTEDEKETPNSKEVFEEVLKQLQQLGDKGKRVLIRLHETMGVEYTEKPSSDTRLMPAVAGTEEELDKLRNVLEEAISEARSKGQRQQKRRDARTEARAKRDLMLGQIELQKQLNEDDEARDYAAEEGLEPDGYAEHHVHLNETTAFDMSNSEFWSSFSSSEEALLECAGLILNLPLTPHSSCRAGVTEQQSHAASRANALTYRVPANGYYFFVFNSENEVQTNYIRARFDLQKTRYDVARTALRECTNTTERCDLPLDIFSSQKVVLEVPLRNNDSLWNEQFVIISECEPRTSVYLACVVAVPILIMIFAFQ